MKGLLESLDAMWEGWGLDPNSSRPKLKRTPLTPAEKEKRRKERMKRAAQRSTQRLAQRLKKPSW